MTRNGITSQEILGDQTSYTNQLARFADALGAGAPFPSGIDGSVANAELIDECYRRAGLSPAVRDPMVPSSRAPRRCNLPRVGQESWDSRKRIVRREW